jgi:hypothetical protein
VALELEPRETAILRPIISPKRERNVFDISTVIGSTALNKEFIVDAVRWR